MHQKIKEIFLEELKIVADSYRGTIEKEIVDRVEKAIIRALEPADSTASSDLRNRFLDRLEEVSEGLSVLFLDNAINDYQYDEFAIGKAFDWCETEQGPGYWFDMHRKWQASILANPL